MAINSRGHLLFIGCRHPQKLIVMDTQTGKVVAALPIGPMVDATKYASGRAFASCGGSGELFVASQRDGMWQVDQIVKTAMGARTMDIDRSTNTIFLPTAEMDSPAHGEPQIRPGPFMLVQVSRH